MCGGGGETRRGEARPRTWAPPLPFLLLVIISALLRLIIDHFGSNNNNNTTPADKKKITRGALRQQRLPTGRTGSHSTDPVAVFCQQPQPCGAVRCGAAADFLVLAILATLPGASGTQLQCLSPTIKRPAGKWRTISRNAVRHPRNANRVGFPLGEGLGWRPFIRQSGRFRLRAYCRVRALALLGFNLRTSVVISMPAARVEV